MLDAKFGVYDDLQSDVAVPEPRLAPTDGPLSRFTSLVKEALF